jgi:hypothetical protein
MKTVAGCLILVAITLSQPCGVLCQELTLEDRWKLELAEKSADRFVERFRRTLDFGTVWPEFHMSDISCTVKTTGIFSLNDYKRLKLDKELLERSYVAVMNYFYLRSVHDLTVSRVDSNLSEDAITPKEIRLTERRSVYVKTNGKEPKTARDLEQMTVELRRLARLYRKYIPRNAMRSAAWRANNNYLMNRSNTTHLGVSSGHPDFCIPETTKYYMVDRGLFYFYIIEEKGKMKIAGLAIDLE